MLVGQHPSVLAGHGESVFSAQLHPSADRNARGFALFEWPMAMSHQQTANGAETTRPLPEPTVAACNFFQVLDIPGPTFVRKIVVDPSIPKRQSNASNYNIRVDCRPHAALDVDVWIRPVASKDVTRMISTSNRTYLDFDAGRDARVRVVRGVRVFAWDHC